MENKKEMQTTIVDIKNNSQTTKEEFLSILKLVAPGTNLRTGLNGVVEAKKGALIIVENELIGQIIDGGFKLNCRFTPQRLIELSKMDGAIILSNDMKRISYANVTLVPDSKIPTKETGTRHKAAERSAKMMNTLAIAVSERKNEINLYYKNTKYHLRKTEEILRSATETLQILEKQRDLFDEHIAKLNQMELRNNFNVRQAARVVQKGKAIEKILESQEKTLIELGNEAIAMKLRIKEIIKDVEKETDLIIKDYTRFNLKKSKYLLSSLTYEDLIDLDNLLISLGQKETNNLESINGWRLLSKTGLSEKEIGEVISKIKRIDLITNARREILEGHLGDDRAQFLIDEIRKISSTV